MVSEVSFVPRFERRYYGRPASSSRTEFRSRGQQNHRDALTLKKVALLLHVAGEEAQEVYQTFDLPEGTSFNEALRKFEDYCIPKKNETYERYKFRIRIQEEGETLEAFYRDLRIQAKSCAFATLEDSMIRDQIVYGITNKKLRQRLLRETDLSMDKAVTMCRASEIETLRSLTFEEKEKGVDKVNATRNWTREQHSDRGADRRCGNCNFVHRHGTCPAFGKICRRCQKYNHFASCCRAAVNDISAAPVEDSIEEFSVLEIGSCTSQGPNWIISAHVSGHPISFKVDTGAQANLLPRSWVQRNVPRAEVRHTSARLRSYSGGVIAHCGVTTLQMAYNGNTDPVQFFVVKKARTPILDLSACEQFKLISRVGAVLHMTDEGRKMLNDFPRVFRGLGCVNRTYKMELKEGTVPVVQPARRIPHALRRPVEQELHRLVDAGILRKADGPTDWVSPMVIARKKNGQLRLCLDPRRINEHLKREHYQLPKREDIQAELADARVFSTLDANSGYHQIPSTKKPPRFVLWARRLDDITTSGSRFVYHQPPKFFMANIFEGLLGVRVYIDDILVWGKTQQEHNERLRAVLIRAQEQHLTLNLEKCNFSRTEVEFLGDVISSEGIRPSPQLISSVQEFSHPTDKKQLHRFLGLINYFGKYIPDLATKTEQLRALLREDSIFEWSPATQKEWSHLKQALTTAPLLALFDLHKPTKVATDASRVGLGAPPFQKHQQGWRPVAYASRVLSESETRYSQIEKEALGIVFGMEKFHDFVYGRQILVETDHRPLLAISKKAIGDMPPRLQRFFLRLMRYDFQLLYVPGKNLIVPDVLSRAHGNNSESAHVACNDVEVHAIETRKSLVSEATAARIALETAKDSTLRNITEQLENHQPIMGEFNTVQSELTVVDGLLFKGTKVVVPTSMRSEMLQRIHDGHLGINKCLIRARQLVFWPGLSGDIKSLIKRCATCQEFSYQQAQEPLVMRQVPSRPWQRIGVDLCQYARKYFLVAYDAYSNFPEVEQLDNTNAHTVVEKLGSIFAPHGIPLEKKEFKWLNAFYRNP
ncbi:uncharacterized protein K02A2.6-like [Ornithodoros turicata]|uniref:uncharacterized protein K02A2.6-like n=1 Tax=Ornithodoros turicata TaxID=34597 RepID=UPI003139B933